MIAYAVSIPPSRRRRAGRQLPLLFCTIRTVAYGSIRYITALHAAVRYASLLFVSSHLHLFYFIFDLFNPFDSLYRRCVVDEKSSERRIRRRRQQYNTDEDSTDEEQRTEEDGRGEEQEGHNPFDL